MRKSVVHLLATLSALCLADEALSQCPTIFNCPQGSPIICDFSGNDTLLWKEPPYTWSGVLETADLYEGAANFSIKVLPCPPGTGLSISYLLLLDLDNDGLLETAVPSDNLPPIGKVFANNAFNPGYTGGFPVVFDKRPLPDSVKYRFALETSMVWDTVVAHLRWTTGNQSLSPRLPEGKHRLKWRVEQNGTVKYCEHSFRIKDCLSPVLDCEDVWSVAIDTGGTAVLFAGDLLLSAQDNITPASLLEFSLRKAGAVPPQTGFPLDDGDPVATLTYDCQELLDSQTVELWVRDRLGNTKSCETSLTVTDDEGVCDAFPTLCARTWWGDSNIVQQTTFKMIWVDTSQQFVTMPLPPLPGGCAEMNTLPPTGAFSLLAENDKKPLNGVSTYDLLLISRHILGIQPFDAPWKFLAADVNKSGSVTTFDVVELRKLVLGIYDKLPLNTSWRFFEAGCTFPDNPFSGYCASEYSFVTMPLSNYPLEIPFIALKIGDVNGTAIPDSLASAAADSRRTPVFLDLPDLNLETGEVYEITMTTAEAGAWLGIQAGVCFDPEMIEIETISPGVLSGMDENVFAQPKPGLLNLSWFSPAPQLVLPDENLLTLRIRALASGHLRDVVSPSEDLASEAYTATGDVRPLQLRFLENTLPVSVGQTSVFPPQPNPTGADAAIPLRLAQPEIVCVEVADLSGKSFFKKEMPLESGAQLLALPASAFPQAGIYVWRVSAGKAAQSGKIVRM